MTRKHEPIENEYGVIDPNLPAYEAINAASEALVASLAKHLDNLPMNQAVHLSRHISSIVDMDVSGYVLSRQHRAAINKRKGAWHPSLGGPGTYYRSECTIDDGVTVNQCLLQDARSFAEWEQDAKLHSRTWNGWLKPVFTLGMGMSLVSQFNNCPGILLEYSRDRDAFIYFDSNSGQDVPDVYVGFMVEDSLGNQVKVYEIGVGWVWSDILDTEGDEQDV